MYIYGALVLLFVLFCQSVKIFCFFSQISIYSGQLLISVQKIDTFLTISIKIFLISFNFVKREITTPWSHFTNVLHHKFTNIFIHYPKLTLDQNTQSSLGKKEAPPFSRTRREKRGVRLGPRISQSANQSAKPASLVAWAGYIHDLVPLSRARVHTGRSARKRCCWMQIRFLFLYRRGENAVLMRSGAVVEVL